MTPFQRARTVTQILRRGEVGRGEHFWRRKYRKGENRKLKQIHTLLKTKLKSKLEAQMPVQDEQKVESESEDRVLAVNLWYRQKGSH